MQFDFILLKAACMLVVNAVIVKIAGITKSRKSAGCRYVICPSLHSIPPIKRATEAALLHQNLLKSGKVKPLFLVLLGIGRAYLWLRVIYESHSMIC